MSTRRITQDRTGPPLFIGGEIYRRSSYGARHPLAIPRVSTTIDLVRAMGWLADDAYIDSPRATMGQLTRFHDPAYVAALIEAEEHQTLAPEQLTRFNLGKLENPIFPEIFSRPATACGGSLLAAEILAGSDRPRIVYHPAGGTHHGRPNRASGFCYLNDPVLAILRLIDRGVARIAYVDLDAHHGDGVEAAFADEPRVLTVSVHEAGRWPFTGQAGTGLGRALNLPVPADFQDDELAEVMARAVLPSVAGFAPGVVVVQCGADALADDPLSRLALSNRGLWRAVADLRRLAIDELGAGLLVLGGGGYNPWSVARCWAGVWAVLTGRDPAVTPTPAARRVLAALTWHRAAGRNPPAHWRDSLADPPATGPVRPAVTAVVDAALRDRAAVG